MSRKINKVETFKPSKKSIIIIQALSEVMPKSQAYNGMIEMLGEQFATKFLTIEQYKKMLSEIEELSKPKE